MKKKYSEIIDTQLGKFIILNTDTNQGMYYKEHNRNIEQHHIDILNELLTKIKEPVVLDIGSNLGFFTFGMSKDIDGCLVYSFEPQRIISNMLAGSVALNCKENIIVKNCAVGDHVGKIKIPKYDYSLVSSFGSVSTSLVENHENIGQHTNTFEEVDIITVDSLNLPKVNLIKIDVEGMEMSVLSGAHNTIVKHKPILFVEFLKEVKPRTLYDLLTSYGYAIQVVDYNFLCIPIEDK
jgi:FkbM family methyltransferase